MSRLVFAIGVALWLSAVWGSAQELRGLTRFLPEQSSASETGATVRIELALSQPVPWKAGFRSDPNELVLSFNELAEFEDWDSGSMPLGDARFEAGEDGWTSMVLPIAEPFAIAEASMITKFGESNEARLEILLAPTTADAYRDSAVAGTSVNRKSPPVIASSKVVVAIDAGHGGVDPGAEVEGLREADLLLIFARSLKEDLLRTGQVEVVMTRDEDIFVSLDDRLTRSRSAGASLLISLHADALSDEDGKAGGATIYTLPQDEGNAASLAEVERHGRDEILTGVDLTGTEDEVALVLMDLARTETAPRSTRLADAVEASFRENDVRLNSRPRRQAPLAVLRAADIPAILVEIGFLSSVLDRPRLTSQEGRAAITTSMRDAILAWIEDEAERAALRRQ